MNNDVVTFYTIDHFAVSPIIQNIIEEAGAVHSGENTSNHAPIYVKLRVGDIYLQLEESEKEARSCWDKATVDAKETFKTCLKSKLKSLPKYECITCHDLKCDSNLHMQGIEAYTLDVLSSMEEAGNECLLLSSNLSKRKHGIPGWTEYVKPYAE